ncbi:MAG: dolichol-phosphate mannosyltransferase [Pelagibacterales bacterium]|nr:dolichol-phosphate mannosyltransferase [Pelagibacterales bacterium]PPR15908.1 MAG: Undecaprenyl-phosphate 4-deoxy-4-formamido-L-arabinose transferase [Alphaproteobacteria bacterium MarineAlpha9_Bin3]|tara:strand:+ start:2330 stop:3061 length:732 start_codon:yes stop_codon:yes gene_type:complete
MNSKISVIIPVYNEEGNIIDLIDEILPIVKKIGGEIIIVDDNSNDLSYDLILRKKDTVNVSILLIKHLKQYGQSAGLLTGIKKANNDIIVTLDGDGQNDPKDIIPMLKVWEENKGNKDLLIIGHRKNRKDTWSRRYASFLAQRFRKYILNDDTPDSGCGIKIFSRSLFLSLPYFDHIHRFLPALTRRNGGSVISHIVSHRNRISGVSKYSNWQRFRVGLVDLFGVSWLIKRSSFPIKLKDKEK